MSRLDSSRRWLFGPVSDLVLGCGLGYAVVFAWLMLSGTGLGSVGWLVALVPLLAGTPHYGATLLRVYEKRSDRRAYVFFTLWVTLALLACFAAGLYYPFFGSLLLSLSITWGPYHYSAQNYGIAAMFLGRRGVELTPRARRALQLSFQLSFVLTFLGIHGAVAGGGQYGTVVSYRGSVFHDMKLGIPSPWWEMVFVGTLAVYLGALAVVARSLLARARPLDLAPSALLVATQAMWFTLPPLARHMGWVGGELSVATAFVWVAAGHTVQYMWITTYYAAHGGGYAARASFYARSLLAGTLLFTAPALIYSLTVEGTSLGGIAFGADVGIYAVAIINLHHFLLDGAVWKLRDGRVARILIRREAEPAGETERGGWLAPALYGLATLAIVAMVFATVERSARLEPAVEQRDLPAVADSLRRLEWVGQVNAADYAAAGRAAERAGDTRQARDFFRKAVKERRVAAYWVRLGRLERDLGRPREALAAFENALEINPGHRPALIELASEWISQGEPARALETLERASGVLPGDQELDALSARARALL